MIDARNEILAQFGMVGANNNTEAEFTEDSGQLIRDTSNILDNLQEQGRMFDEYDEALASNNIERAEDIRNKFTVRQIMDAIENGTANTLERAYQAVANLTGEEAMQYGITDSASNLQYQANAKDAISKLRRMETQTLRNKKYLNRDSVNADS